MNIGFSRSQIRAMGKGQYAIVLRIGARSNRCCYFSHVHYAASYLDELTNCWQIN
jgi:hypothetical protein